MASGADELGETALAGAVGVTVTDERSRVDDGVAAGTRIGRYMIERRLGAGGMGVVYAARDPELGRSVAIKLLHPDAIEQDDLLKEGRATAQLRHPNVVTIHDVGWYSDRLFIAMELVTGGTLRSWLETKRKRRDVLVAFLGAGAGLAAAHGAGLVHRDFKPDNVLVDTDGRVLVTDFGLAHAMVVTTAKDESAPTELTRRGEVVGTPAYMSPEQFAGDALDARSDLFSFCVALAEGLQGFRPFAGATYTELRAAVTTREPRLELPRGLARVIGKGLARDRDQRTPTMAALLDDLRPRRRAVWIAGGVGAAGAAAALVIALRAGAPATAACDANEVQIDTAWTAEARTAVLQRSPGYGAADVAQVEEFRARWKALHRDTCRLGTHDETHARAEQQFGCLERARAAFGAALIATPFLNEPETRLALPELATCGGERPARALRELAIGDRDGDTRVAVLSDDGKRFACATGNRIEIAATDGSQRRTIDIAGAERIAWDHDQLVVATESTLTRKDLAGSHDTTFNIGDVIALAPHGDRALTVRDGQTQIVDLHTLTHQPANATVPSDRRVPIAWSTSDQLAFTVERDVDIRTVIRVVDLASGHTDEMPTRVLSNAGTIAIAWLDPETLAFSGGADAEHGVGLWTVPVHAGRFTGPATPLAAAPPGVVYEPLDAGGGRLLVQRLTLHSELARIRDGKSASLSSLPALLGLWDARPDGEVLAVTRETDVGTFEVRSGEYAKRAPRPHRVAFSGFELLVDGSPITASGPATDPGIRAHCAALAPYTCVRAMPTPDGKMQLQLASGQDLGSYGGVDSVRFNFAISPTADRVAFAAGTRLEVIDVATGRVDTWLDGLTGECSLAIQAMAWSRQPPDAVYFSELCPNIRSRVVRLARGGVPVEVFASEAWISGLATAPNDDLFVGLRRFSTGLLVLDGF